MRKVILTVVVSVFSCAFVAGCSNEPPVKPSKACRSVGGVKMCDTTINGEDCTILNPGRAGEEIKCADDDELACDARDNTSGNICKLKVGTRWCVAVLPDGGKSPKYKPDYIQCPEQEPVNGKG